jgi:23S rRNA (uracil1939-C5)-methyltransferase
VFDAALTDIATFTSPKDALLDFYAGVGAIGIPISKNRDSLTLVESNEDAIHFATKNITANDLKQARIQGVPAEFATDAIDDTSVLIVDPPRAGLHPKVISRILLKKPPRIIYLSCGLDTQARDLALLSEAYRPVFYRLYNFFPRTPHIEGLVVLERV